MASILLKLQTQCYLGWGHWKVLWPKQEEIQNKKFYLVKVCKGFLTENFSAHLHIIPVSNHSLKINSRILKVLYLKKILKFFETPLNCEVLVYLVTIFLPIARIFFNLAMTKQYWFTKSSKIQKMYGWFERLT